MRRTCPIWVRLIATFFGTGLIYPGPGSWAAGVTALICWQAGRWITPKWQLPVVVVGAVMAVLAGIPTASWMARIYKLKNPDFVVIDEVAGQLVSLIGVPLSGGFVLVAFAQFSPSTLRVLWRAALGYMRRSMQP